jgi:hypothetical protein
MNGNSEQSKVRLRLNVECGPLTPEQAELLNAWEEALNQPRITVAVKKHIDDLRTYGSSVLDPVNFIDGCKPGTVF